MKKIKLIYTYIYPVILIGCIFLFIAAFTQLSHLEGIKYFTILGLELFISFILFCIYATFISITCIQEKENLIKITKTIKLSSIIPNLVLTCLAILLTSLLFTIFIAFLISLIQLTLFLTTSILGTTAILKNKQYYKENDNHILYILLMYIPIASLISSLIISVIYKKVGYLNEESKT